MSGHGGGGGGSSNGGEVSDCTSLIFSTTLNSPVQHVISELSVQDILDVVRRAPQERLIVATTSDGDVAGSITHARQVDLLRCMEDEGMAFVAVVQRVSGGACDVQIRPRAG